MMSRQRQISTGLIMQVWSATLLICALLSTVCSQAPVVSVQPRSLSVSVGKSLVFRCRLLSGSSPVQLQWRKMARWGDSGRLGANVRVSADGEKLWVSGADATNEGGFRCIATNREGRGTATGFLSITKPPEVVLSPSGQLMVRAGENVSIECKASGTPRTSIRWFRQEAGSLTQLDSIPSSDSSATLQVTVMGAEDVGMFVCRAESKEELAEGRVQLKLHPFPKALVRDTDLRAVEGQSVTMHCRAHGVPIPEISWSKLRAPLPWQHRIMGGNLTLSNVGRQDSGQYICNASSTLGYSEAYVQLEVDAPPYATTLTDEVTVRRGDAIRLQCLALGTHPIHFRWTRADGAPVSPRAETSKDGLLKIDQLTATDAGTYKCVASNHVGSSEAFSVVSVTA